MQNSTTKRCSMCGEDFPATPEFFYRNRADKTGYVSKCKNCHSIASGYKSRRRSVDFAVDGLPKGFKRCTKCEVVYPATAEFYDRSIRGHYGLGSRCKECRKKYAQEHAVSIRDYHKQYYEAHQDYWKEKRREYYLQHRDAMLQQSKDWHAKHPESTRDSKRRYKKKNPGLANHHSRVRRVRLMNVESGFTYDEWVRCLEYFDYKCAVCGRTADLWIRIVTDHWYPVAKGGADVATNIIPLCQEKGGCPTGQPCCNSNKSAKDPIIWLNTFVGKHKARKILARINAYFEWVKEQA